MKKKIVVLLAVLLAAVSCRAGWEIDSAGRYRLLLARRKATSAAVSVVFGGVMAYSAARAARTAGRLNVPGYMFSAVSGVLLYRSGRLFVAARNDLRGVRVAYQF